MNLFFDTSALVKLFSNEAGSETVKELITNPANNIYVLDLALIELQSAVYRKYRNKQIHEENLEKFKMPLKNKWLILTLFQLVLT